MRNPMAALCVFAFLSTPGCSPQTPETEPSAASAVPAPVATPDSVAPDGGGMNAVLDSGNIGRRLDIFERRVGAPQDAGEGWSSYTVDGCGVQVVTEGNIIRWIELELTTDDCRVDLEPLVGKSRLASKGSPLTFGEFDALASKQTFYTFSCPGIDCGNAMEGAVSVVTPGIHANNWLDVEARSSMVDDYDNFFKWKEQVQAGAGENAMELNLECDRRFDDLSRRVLASARVDAIGFGKRKPFFPCH